LLREFRLFSVVNDASDIALTLRLTPHDNQPINDELQEVIKPTERRDDTFVDEAPSEVP
jgi:hypothetical protein